jgi:hypothetical protein
VAGGGTAGSGTAGSGTAGSGATGCGTPAATTVGGVLTTYPNITYSIDTGFAVKSANFTVLDDGDTRGPLLTLFAEIQNNLTTPQCDFLPSVTLDGQDLIGLTYGAPYFNHNVTTVTTDCIAPGQVGVLTAVARGITAADLAAASFVSIGLSPGNFGTYLPATDRPLITANPTPGAMGDTLSGTVTPPATIHNYGMHVFPHDSRGVVSGDLRAFPNNLATLNAGVAVSFATEAVSCPFTTYMVADSWIEGP